MQLYASDSSGQLIFSCHAEKKRNYECLECGSIVRLKEGIFRHPHFFHLQNQAKCRQNGKSQVHLQLQFFLKNKLPKGEAELECRFPNINRIADVAWHPQKIIFEIQCSPLTKEEMEGRMKDYASLGYSVVWVLHDSQYNQWRKSPLELALSPPYYYTNMDESGNGIIYDQWHYVEKGLRKKSLPPLFVDLTKPYFSENNLSFSGDIASLPKNHPYLLKISEYEKQLAPVKKSLLDLLKTAFESLLKTLLKPHCKD